MAAARRVERAVPPAEVAHTPPEGRLAIACMTPDHKQGVRLTTSGRWLCNLVRSVAHKESHPAYKRCIAVPISA